MYGNAKNLRMFLGTSHVARDRRRSESAAGGPAHCRLESPAGKGSG